MFAALFTVILLASSLAVAATVQQGQAPPDRVSSGTIAFEQSSISVNLTDGPVTATLTGIVSISMTPQIRTVTVQLFLDDSGGLEAALTPDTLTFTGSGEQNFAVDVLVPANGTEDAVYQVTVSGRYFSSPGALAYNMPPSTAMIEALASGDDTNATTKTKKSTSSGGFFSFLGDMCCCIVLLPIFVVLLIVLLILWLIRRKRRAAGVATTVAGASATAPEEKKGFFDSMRDRIKDRRASLPKPGANLGAHRLAASAARPSAPSIGAHRPAASVSRPSAGGGAKGGLLGKRGR